VPPPDVQINVKSSVAELPAVSVAVRRITYVPAVEVLITVLADVVEVSGPKLNVPGPETFDHAYVAIPESSVAEPVWVNWLPWVWSAPALTVGAVVSKV